MSLNKFLSNSSILLSIGLLFTVAFIGGNQVQVSAQDRPTETISGVVPIDRTNPVPIYFKYGSVNSDINIASAQATIVISDANNPSNTPAFEFIKEGNQDVFNGDPSRPDTDPAPASPGNCKTFTAPRYNIPTGFFSNTKMSAYGLQTAKTVASPNAILTQKSTGCISVQVKLNSNAKIGDKVNVLFDWDAGNSPDLRLDQRPSLSMVTLEVVAGAKPAATPVATSQAAAPVVSSTATSVTPTQTPASSKSSSKAVVAAAVQSTPRSGGFETMIVFSLLGLLSSALIFFRIRKVLPGIDI